MSRLAFLSCASLCLASVVASCGGDEPAPATVPVDDFCVGWVTAICSAAERCGCLAEVEPMACVAAAASGCVLDRGRPTREMVDMGTLPYDGVAAARLHAAIEASACDERATLCDTSGPCLGVSAEGGACGETIGCAAGLSCQGGVCSGPAADGATCTTPEACASGRCERGQCEPAAEVGTPCSIESECASGNCDFATGRCRAKEPLEALCTEHSECESGYCDRDLELGAGNCRPQQPLGGTCDEDQMCSDGACFEEVCGPALCDVIME